MDCPAICLFLVSQLRKDLVRRGNGDLIATRLSCGRTDYRKPDATRLRRVLLHRDGLDGHAVGHHDIALSNRISMESRASPLETSPTDFRARSTEEPAGIEKHADAGGERAFVISDEVYV